MLSRKEVSYINTKSVKTQNFLEIISLFFSFLEELEMSNRGGFLLAT
jgi:hypothetical protein